MNLGSDATQLRHWATSLDQLVSRDDVSYQTAVKLTKAAGETRLAAVHLTRTPIAASEHLELARTTLESITRQDTSEWIFELARNAAAVLMVNRRVLNNES
jgi:hypothetical protein